MGPLLSIDMLNSKGVHVVLGVGKNSSYITLLEDQNSNNQRKVAMVLDATLLAKVYLGCAWHQLEVPAAVGLPDEDMNGSRTSGEFDAPEFPESTFW